MWDKASDWDNWVKRIQQKRNAIHAFNDRDIGTFIGSLEDIDMFIEFINIIDSRLPYPD